MFKKSLLFLIAFVLLAVSLFFLETNSYYYGSVLSSDGAETGLNSLAQNEPVLDEEDFDITPAKMHEYVLDNRVGEINEDGTVTFFLEK